MKISNFKTFLILNKEKVKWFSILFVLLCGIAFASIVTDLTINGVLSANRDSFNVEFSNIQVTSGSVSVSNPTFDKTSVIQTVTLAANGDFYEYKFNVSNNGEVDAMIGEIILPEVDSKVTYTIKYSGNVNLNEKDLVAKDDSYSIIVRVEYTGENSGTISNVGAGVVIKYVKADDTAHEIPSLKFKDYSWSEISTMIQSGDTASLKVGDTKCVALNGFTTTNENGCENGEFSIRISNKSTPSECSEDDFSQSSCGFVFEFVDIISMNYYMNPEGTYKGVHYDYGWNVDGWPECAMRTYVNNTIYDALPSDLKNVIIETNVVSGHGNTTGEENFTSTDKLFLLSAHEVYENQENSISSNFVPLSDTAYNSTRQLDYYRNKELIYMDNLTQQNSTFALKQNNKYNNIWGLRSPSNGNDSMWSYISGDNNYQGFLYRGADSRMGASPAFRIG